MKIKQSHILPGRRLPASIAPKEKPQTFSHPSLTRDFAVCNLSLFIIAHFVALCQTRETTR